jgi:uncharacterized protein (TIGR02646 family)
MIRVQRPDSPGVLVSRGAARRQRDCKAYEGDPHAYRRGDVTFRADPKIYGHDSVKASLLGAQYDKCCYCERKIRASGYGDVEHFRPKGAVRQDEHCAEEKPGYYWLVYEWSNLLISCAVCNTSWKRTFFPLDNPRGRARSHLDPLTRERPMLVDPAAENPRDHIRYSGDAPYALTARGQRTIERLGLRRGDLLERRQALLRTLTHLRSVVEALGPMAEARDANAHMQHLAESSEEFSSMVTDFLAAPFVPASPS